MKIEHYTKELDLLGYDPNDSKSVLAFAKEIQGKSLNQVLSKNLKISDLKKSGNKGDLGLLVEELFFHIKNNNDSEPDIPESGIEIKTGQFIYKPNAGKSFKERLKLASINYHEFNSYKSIYDTPLWKKIQKILLLMFIHQKGIDKLNLVCDWVDFLEYSKDDIEVFAQDWLKIKNYVITGQADKITESFTSYLAANTAGKNSQDTTSAPGGIMAKRRAFSFKTSYLNTLFKLRKSKVRATIGDIKVAKGQTFEEAITEKIKAFHLQSCSEICEKLGIIYSSKPKNAFALVSKQIHKSILNNLTNHISGSKSTFKDFSQLLKSDTKVKTIVLEKNGNLKESISLPAINWIELSEEDCWEDSLLYKQLSQKFLFYVFKKTDEDKNPILIKSFFWYMPANDLEKMYQLWLDTKNKILAGLYGDFLKKSNHDVGHVRPHAKNATDKLATPQGGQECKKSFWLNNDYILNVVNKN